MQCSHIQSRLGNFSLWVQDFLSSTLFPSPPECQQLIKWCLALRPSDRPTLEQICDHPWMRATTESPKSPEEPVAGDIRLRTIDTDSSSSTSSSKESLWGWLWWTESTFWGKKGFGWREWYGLHSQQPVAQLAHQRLGASLSWSS